MNSDWSKPDMNGISTFRIDTGAKITLRGKRKRRALIQRTLETDHWPSDMRKLAIAWVKSRTSIRVRWSTLTRAAGTQQIETAYALIEELLKFGLITVEEEFKSGEWHLLGLEFTELEVIRQSLGMQSPDSLTARRDELLANALREPKLELVKSELRDMPPLRAIALCELLSSLDNWIENALEGTEREFALRARGDTKGVSAGEWRWLRSKFDLASFGVEPHSPILWIKAPCRLVFGESSSDEDILDLSTMSDFIGLPKRQVNKLSSIQGTVKLWRLFENRTNFENAAARQEKHSTEAIVLIPGFPPPWWRESVSKILKFCSAPAEISCDPDPAGIHIAMLVGSIWTENNLKWKPAGMSPKDLASLEHKKALNEFDADELRALFEMGLPPELTTLAEYILSTGFKGEQEGLLSKSVSRISTE